MSNSRAILELLILMIVSIIAISILRLVKKSGFKEATKSVRNKLAPNYSKLHRVKITQKSFAEIIEESVNLAIEKTKQNKLVEVTSDNSTSLYSLSLKETLKPIFTKKVFELAIEECHTILNKGNLVEKMELELIIINKTSLFKEYLIEKKDELEMTKKDILDLIDEISISVSTRFANLDKNKKTKILA